MRIRAAAEPIRSPESSSGKRCDRWFWALGGAIGVLWLAVLGGRSLIGTDEGRYASLALAMFDSGDWLTPRLNGLLYFEKPPLQYWAGALSYEIFGVNAFAARLWPGLAGLAVVALVGYTADRLWGRRSGVAAMLIAASTTWISANSHFLSLDMGLCAALTLTMCSVLLAQHSGLPSRQAGRWMLAAWFGISVGILSKGVVAVLIPGATLVIHSLWRRDVDLWRHLRWRSGLAVVLIVAVPWFVLMSLRHPDFANFFFIHEHVERFLTTEHHRTGSWWYFVPILLAGLLPWTAALPWLLKPHRDDFALSFLLVWAAFVFVFFSFSGSKLPSYILPMFPALALLAARAFISGRPRAFYACLAVPTLLWAIALLSLPEVTRLFSSQTPAAAIRALQIGVGIGAALFLVGALVAFVLLRGGRSLPALAVVAVAHLGATLVVMQSHDTFGQLKSADALARVVVPLVGADAPIFAVRAYDQTLPFYLRRPVILVDYQDEFSFGEKHEPSRWIPSLDDFIVRWQHEPRAAAYMTRATYSLLAARGAAMRVAFEDPNRLVVVKP